MSPTGYGSIRCSTLSPAHREVGREERERRYKFVTEQLTSEEQSLWHELGRAKSDRHLRPNCTARTTTQSPATIVGHPFDLRS